jgi:RNA polymerase sigma factor (sigma-70 family)
MAWVYLKILFISHNYCIVKGILHIKPTLIFLKIEEKELITGCLEGNRYYQSQLYGYYSPKMLIVCLRYAKNREEAEEILQDGFIKVLSNLHQFNFMGSFEGWIRKIILNCALQKYRSNSQKPVVHLFQEDQHESADSTDLHAILQSKELLSLVQSLSPSYRMVFNLYVFEGLKHSEIAVLLGISEGTSKSNLFNARNILQKAVLGNVKKII